jgi:hypothetical protein
MIINEDGPKDKRKDVLQAAIEYAKKGYRVIPCYPDTKKPSLKDWPNKATTDEATIKAWFDDGDDFNIGLVAGRESGFVVVDVDPRNGGSQSYEDLINRFGQADQTPTQLTPSGGYHYFYKYEDGIKKHVAAAGIDIISDGGFVVVEPSTIGGKGYFWDLETSDKPLSSPPIWVRRKAEPDPKPDAGSDLINESQRNTKLTSLGGSLRNIGLAAAEIQAALSSINRSRCRPPLSEDEVAGIANSVAKYKAGSAPDKSLAELRPIPFSELAENYPNMREVLVDGLLRTGEVMNIIASPKVGKSLFIANLAWSLVTGRPFLNRQVKKSRVLVIDNELHTETIVSRYSAVAEALAIPTADRIGLDFLHIRGNSLSIYDLRSLEIEAGRYGLVVLDALYRFIPRGTSENDNAAVMSMYNELDCMADKWKSSVAPIHHSSKGNQSEKDVTDMGSGAGSISRAADSHVILRPHAEDGLFVMEAVTRTFKTPPPASLRYEYPIWIPTDVDPKLRTPNQKRNTRQDAIDLETTAAIVEALGDKSLSESQLRNRTGFGLDRVKRGLRILSEAEKVSRRLVRRNGKKTAVFHRLLPS